MAYGRVKHKPRERIGSRQIKTVTFVGRDNYGPRARYQAYSCLARTGAAAKSGNKQTWTQTCTANVYARTPQSAIAKSLKKMAIVIAKRNRVKRRRQVRKARGW